MKSGVFLSKSGWTFTSFLLEKDFQSNFLSRNVPKVSQEKRGWWAIEFPMRSSEKGLFSSSAISCPTAKFRLFQPIFAV